MQVPSHSDCQPAKETIAYSAASLAPEAKTFCNGSVLTGGVSENIYSTKFEWLGNSFLSIGKYKQRYPREKKRVTKAMHLYNCMLDLLVLCIIIVQGICWRIFSTRLNLQMACKARGHTKHENNKARHWIAAHYVSITQPKHWQNRGRNRLWWGHLSVLPCILAALHKLSLGSCLHLCKAVLHLLWETCTMQSHEGGCR